MQTKKLGIGHSFMSAWALFHESIVVEAVYVMKTPKLEHISIYGSNDKAVSYASTLLAWCIWSN